MSVMREEMPPTEGGRGTSNPLEVGNEGEIGVEAVLESAMAERWHATIQRYLWSEEYEGTIHVAIIGYQNVLLAMNFGVLNLMLTAAAGGGGSEGVRGKE